MTEIVNLGDIIVNYFNQDKTLQETAADLGAIILEMDPPCVRIVVVFI